MEIIAARIAVVGPERQSKETFEGEVCEQEVLDSADLTQSGRSERR